jgi:hypothetical protein
METISDLRICLARLFENTYTRKVIVTFWDLFVQLFPSLIAGVLLSSVLIVCLPRDRLGAFLNRRGFLALASAVCLGAISPIGTYAVIPFIASLMRAGTFPRAPLMAFLIASPLINPLLFFLTRAAFGLEMALMRVAAALVLGALGGILSFWIWKAPRSPASPAPSTPWPGFSRHAFGVELLKQSKFIGRIFTLSLLVAAAVSALVPADLIFRVLGGESSFTVLLAVLLGIPLYACGGGTIPVMAVLHDMGMSQGAILGFFISGPATKASTLAALFAAMDRKTVILYLAITLIGAFAFGMVYNLF